MGGLSWWHWLIVVAAFVLLFGAKKLPDAARGVGRSLRILKSEVSAMNEDDIKNENGEAVPVPTPAVLVAAPAVAPAQPAVALGATGHRSAAERV